MGFDLINNELVSVGRRLSNELKNQPVFVCIGENTTLSDIALIKAHILEESRPVVFIDSKDLSLNELERGFEIPCFDSFTKKMELSAEELTRLYNPITFENDREMHKSRKKPKSQEWQRKIGVLSKKFTQ